ncbi:MAG: response regulator [Phycisphaerales bacterium]
MDTPESQTQAQTRVLVVDDEAPIVRVVAKRFEAAGYTVLTASNGKEGLELALTQRPHLVISDVQMPILDGLSFARALNERLGNNRPPFILLTARSFMISDKDIAQAGVTSLMSKPFSARKLIEMAQSILNKPSEAEAA